MAHRSTQRAPEAPARSLGSGPGGRGPGARGARGGGGGAPRSPSPSPRGGLRQPGRAVPADDGAGHQLTRAGGPAPLTGASRLTVT